jgi:hypothetical protein
VEKVRAVTMDLDACLRIFLAVRIAANMVAAVDYSDLQAQLRSGPFCDSQSEKAGANDDEVSGHKISWFESGQPKVVHWLLL